MAASVETLKGFTEANPDIIEHLDPKTFPPAEVERGLKIAAATHAGHLIDEVLKAVGKNEIVPKVSADPGEEDQVAMGAVGAAGKALLKQALKGSGKALTQARKRGREIRDLVRKQTRKPNEKGELPKPNPIPAAEIVTTAKRLFDEINEERRAAGKKEQSKIEMSPHDLRPDASVEDTIEGLVVAVIDGELAGLLRRDDVVELRLQEVDSAWAERVNRDVGVDLSRLIHAIDTPQIKHALARHGPGSETDPAQEPVSPELISVYQTVVENYDTISDVRTRNGEIRLRFEKRVNGVVAVVEQVRRGKGTLSFFDMWLKIAE